MHTDPAAPAALAPVTATAGRFAITLTPGTGYARGMWIRTTACEGAEFGDAMAMRVPDGTDPAEYVAADVARLAAARA